jgi:uncharacterized protein (TIGR02271 family)
MMTEDETTEAQTLRVPVAEEDLTARVVEQEQGAVRITKRVEEVPMRADIDLRTDDVAVTRHARDEVVAEAREPWYEGDELVIPLYEERLVTEKRLVLIAEVRVRSTPSVETVHLRDTVRRETVDVERVPAELPTPPE